MKQDMVRREKKEILREKGYKEVEKNEKREELRRT